MDNTSLLYEIQYLPSADLSPREEEQLREMAKYLEKNQEPESKDDFTRVNRLLLEAAFPGEIESIYECRLKKIWKKIHELPKSEQYPQSVRSALCLSGGGIRSASLALGVIQGLTRYQLLEKFDYLSTVSGGGYIGSWLTAWIYRQGCDLRLKDASDSKHKDKIIRKFKMEFESKRKRCAILLVRENAQSNEWTLAGFNDAGAFHEDIVTDNHNDDLWKELKKEPKNKSRIVELATSYLGCTPPQGKNGKDGINVVTQELCNESPPARLEPASKPIQFLREYSNFITPKVGLFTTDTWAFVAIYLRNLFINWLAIIPLLLAILALPRLYAALVKFILKDTQNLSGVFGLIGLIMLSCPVICIALNKPGTQDKSDAKDSHPNFAQNSGGSKCSSSSGVGALG